MTQLIQFGIAATIVAAGFLLAAIANFVSGINIKNYKK